jgi:peptide methionine sulfoxide reductase MsrA
MRTSSPAGPFCAAETYRQEYYLENPTEYPRYAIASGRYSFLERTWGIKH